MPKEYGGRGLGFVEQRLFLEEPKNQSLPTGQLRIQSIIPALVFFASEEIIRHVREADVLLAYFRPAGWGNLETLHDDGMSALETQHRLDRLKTTGM